VLKPNGAIIFSEPNGTNPQIFLQKRIGWIKRRLLDTPTETAFFRWRLAKVLRQSGFTQISVKPFEFLHPLTPGFLINLIKRIEHRMERFWFIREISGSLLIFAKKQK
jgi:hypothetical protein